MSERCEAHGMAPGLCTVRGCPSYDGGKDRHGQPRRKNHNRTVIKGRVSKMARERAALRLKVLTPSALPATRGDCVVCPDCQEWRNSVERVRREAVWNACCGVLGRCETTAMRGPLRLRGNNDDTAPVCDQWSHKKLRVQEGKVYARRLEQPPIQYLESDETSVLEPEAPKLQELRWPWHPCLRAMADELCRVRERHGRAPARRDHRAEEQLPGLQSGQLHLGYARGPVEEYQAEPVLSDPRGKDASRRCLDKV